MIKEIRLILWLSFTVVMVFNIFNAFHTDQEQKKLKMDTYSYLEKKGYHIETDIAEIYIVNVGTVDNEFASIVIFNDEPMVDYCYMYIGNSKVLQQVDAWNSERNKPLKHSEN